MLSWSLVHVILQLVSFQSKEMEECLCNGLGRLPSLASVPKLAEEEQKVVDRHEAIEVDVGGAA